jgi:hypothetical protein
LVAGSGKRLDAITTQEQARRDFGAPVASGVVEGQPYDDFRTHRKVSEGWKGIYFCMGDAWTLGLGEVVWLPHELYVAARRSILGQTVRFVYEPDGSESRVLLDGDHVPGAVRPHAVPESQVVPTGATTEEQGGPK